MSVDSETFVRQWADGKTKKKKHGNYYTVNYHDATFLMWHSDGHSQPAIIAVKSKGKLILNQANQYDQSALQNRAWACQTFSTVEAAVDDITEWKVVYDDNDAQIIDINYKYYLVDNININGAVTSFISGEGGNREPPIASLRERRMIKLPGRAEDPVSARRSLIPDEYIRDDVIFLYGALLVPERDKLNRSCVENFETQIRIKAQPCALGYGIPIDLLRKSYDSTYVMEYNWEHKAKKYGSEVKESADKFMSDLKHFKQVSDNYVRHIQPSINSGLLSCTNSRNFYSTCENCCSEPRRYMKGKWGRNNDNPPSVNIDLGDTWHSIHIIVQRYWSNG